MSLEITSSWKALAEAGLSLIYPSACQICGEARSSRDEGYVCVQCWKKVRFIQEPFCDRCGLPYDGAITTEFECSNCREMELHFSSARSAVVARDLVLDVIHRYKYSRALWFEPFLADLLIRRAKPVLAGQNWNVIVPVPLHPVKKREREFNQAERLAQALSHAIDVPVNTSWIERAEFTRTQTLLTKTQRMANVQGAFRMKTKRKLNGENIILLDDVMTTGATTSACAKVLQRAGAGHICVWTVARGL